MEDEDKAGVSCQTEFAEEMVFVASNTSSEMSKEENGIKSVRYGARKCD